MKDAISDLPHEADLSSKGKDSKKKWQRAYDSAPQSHFQRKMRNISTDLIDHVSEKQNPLNQARYMHDCIKNISQKIFHYDTHFLGSTMYLLGAIGGVSTYILEIISVLIFKLPLLSIILF